MKRGNLGGVRLWELEDELHALAREAPPEPPRGPRQGSRRAGGDDVGGGGRSSAGSQLLVRVTERPSRPLRVRVTL